ncbi:MAG: hypothetical protein A3C47_02085 [Omnitrophica bacterium RIFCSPHIGHO2_02_FULL_51_18]|nr:MAG: hypothetical protein A3C47_02085 [Omnitrophica bacterium RIFCSPHIGHO2_02_FULL_51_18]
MPKEVPLAKLCSACGSNQGVEIETVTNVMPQPGEMYPVLLCAAHRKALQEKWLDIVLDKTGKLNFILKKNAR